MFMDQIFRNSDFGRGVWSEINEDLEQHVARHNKDYKVANIDLFNENFDKVITDNIVYDRESIWLGPEYWGKMYYYRPRYTNCLPDKTYNCFINRADPFRQSWLYLLVRQDLLSDGYVSFNAHDRFSDRTPLETYDYFYTQGLDNFSAEHYAIRDKIPYSNLLGSLDQTVVNSKISLVIETYFAESRGISFSEKTFRALQLPRPFVIFGHPNCINVLRDIGLDTYDDLVDHSSYDSCTNSVERQTNILKIINDFKLVEYNNNLITKLEQRASANRQRLKELKEQWPDKLSKVKELIATK
jgi:hypothetical protein